MITKIKIRQIYALASKIGGMNSEALHTYVYKYTGNEHITRLTDKQAMLITDKLIKLAGKVENVGKKSVEIKHGSITQVINVKGAMTDGQRKKIFALMYDLNWTEVSDSGKKVLHILRLNKFCEKTVKIKSFELLTYYQASNIIEALKQMVKRSENGGG